MKRPNVYPTSDFNSVTLETATIPPGAVYARLIHERFPNPLGFSKTPSRFSDPRKRIESKRFGVLYLGSTLKVCFVEAVLRDRRNGFVGDYLISEAELQTRLYADIAVVQPLTLVDLRGDAGLRMGVLSDVARSSQQTLARAWSAAVYDHPQAPDGIVYPSRLNGETNLAICDRAVSKLSERSVTPLLVATGLADLLDELKVALI